MRARRVLSVNSPAFILVDVYILKTGTCGIPVQHSKAPFSMGCADSTHYYRKKTPNHSSIIISIDVAFCGTSVNRD